MLLNSPSSSSLEFCSGCIILTHCSPHSVTSFVCRYNDGRVHMHHVIRYDMPPSVLPLCCLIIGKRSFVVVAPQCCHLTKDRNMQLHPPRNPLCHVIYLFAHMMIGLYIMCTYQIERWPERNLSFPSADCEAAICGEDMVHCRRSGSCFCFRHLR